eukprot:153852-Hanusia_phi.AAC.1
MALGPGWSWRDHRTVAVMPRRPRAAAGIGCSERPARSSAGPRGRMMTVPGVTVSWDRMVGQHLLS